MVKSKRLFLKFPALTIAMDTNKANRLIVAKCTSWAHDNYNRQDSLYVWRIR